MAKNIANLKLPRDYSKTELIFNLINQKLDDIATKVDKLEEKVDTHNTNLNGEIVAIKKELLINKIKRSKSLSHFVDIGWEKVLGKGIEYAIMGAIIYVVSHIKT